MPKGRAPSARRERFPAPWRSAPPGRHPSGRYSPTSTDAAIRTEGNSLIPPVYALGRKSGREAIRRQRRSPVRGSVSASTTRGGEDERIDGRTTRLWGEPPSDKILTGYYRPTEVGLGHEVSEARSTIVRNGISSCSSADSSMFPTYIFGRRSKMERLSLVMTCGRTAKRLSGTGENSGGG